MSEKITAGISTLTPISTLFDLVGISRLLQIFSIQDEPDLPTEIIKSLQLYVSLSVTTLKSLSPLAITSVTGVLKMISA